MLIHKYLNKKHNVYKQSKRTIIWGGKQKEAVLNKIVKLTQEFEETRKVVFY